MEKHVCLGEKGGCMPAPHLLGKTGQWNQVSSLLPVTVWTFFCPTNTRGLWLIYYCRGKESQRGPGTCVHVVEQLLGGDLDSWPRGFESLRSLLLSIDSALLPSSANSLLCTRPCFDPQEADYCGVHYQPPLPSTFLLTLS